jgi:hypothetical protein
MAVAISESNSMSPQNTTLAAMRQPDQSVVTMGFQNQHSYELMLRAAKMLSSSTLVPVAYRAYDEKKKVENPSAIPNCVIAMNMARRMNADELMVMQNLYIVEGRPAWSATWIIAAINSCGRFSPLRFDIKDLGTKDVEYTVSEWENGQRKHTKVKVTVRDLECVAWAIEKESGERIESPRVSIEMAVKEGWYGKSGSKWQTMPEVMLRYRTASFFGKTYAPELLMGLQSVEDVHDIVEVNPDGTVGSVTTEKLRKARPIPTEDMPTETARPAADTAQQPDPNTGEVPPPAPTPKPPHLGDQDPSDVTDALADHNQARPLASPTSRPARERRTSAVE